MGSSGRNTVAFSCTCGRASRITSAAASGSRSPVSFCRRVCVKTVRYSSTCPRQKIAITSWRGKCAAAKRNPPTASILNSRSTGVRISRLHQFLLVIYQPTQAIGKVSSVQINQVL